MMDFESQFKRYQNIYATRLCYEAQERIFVVYCQPSHKEIPKKRGFEWDANRRRWITKSVDVAERMMVFGTDEAVTEIFRRKNRRKVQP